MRSFHGRRTFLVLLAALGLFTAPLAAQAWYGINGPHYDIARADQLRLQALALYGNPDAWNRVASLHEQSARLRPPGDPYRVRDLTVAAAIRERSGDHSKAGELVAEAADASLAIGNIAQAANLYITAAIITNRGGDGATALALVGKAQLLVGSQFLSTQQRASIRARIVQTQESVAAK